MSNLTAQELIYKQMILDALDQGYVSEKDTGSLEDCESFCDLWYELKEASDNLYDIEYETRNGMEIHLHPKTSSRHYEIDVHAMEVEGIWVAWDYYYGGGKHGEPEAFDWISNARIVECEEKVVTKVEYTFKEYVYE